MPHASPARAVVAVDFIQTLREKALETTVAVALNAVWCLKGSRFWFLQRHRVLCGSDFLKTPFYSCGRRKRIFGSEDITAHHLHLQPLMSPPTDAYRPPLVRRPFFLSGP